MTDFIITFIAGMEVGAIIAILDAARTRRLDKEYYLNKLKELDDQTRTYGNP
jgi:uncharacterized membrane-anchored protein YhcB (DUF1043 family)